MNTSTYLTCCSCGSRDLHVTDGNGCPAVRCNNCNVKMVITNPSYLTPEARRWLESYAKRWKHLPPEHHTRQ
jgi:hypothetical protein